MRSGDVISAELRTRHRASSDALLLPAGLRLERLHGLDGRALLLLLPLGVVRTVPPAARVGELEKKRGVYALCAGIQDVRPSILVVFSI